jgi:hypothetical protein
MTTERKNVIKGTAVSPSTDRLINDICAVCNYYHISVNGDDQLDASTLMRCAFEKMVESREPAINVFLKLIKIKHKNGVPLNDEEITGITKEISNRMVRS